MPEYAIVYHNAKMLDTPEEGAAHRQNWQEWIDGLGDAIVNPGTPFGPSKIVSSDGVSDATPNGLKGFAIVKAADFEEAIEIAKGDPYLRFGAVEVAELMKMG
ncbi:MAG: hypothetical protein IH960_08975 [Chloroflexi bacterium]|nr:hypothetical protein [Chloroflexota bacterium]